MTSCEHISHTGYYDVHFINLTGFHGVCVAVHKYLILSWISYRVFTLENSYSALHFINTLVHVQTSLYGFAESP